MRKTWHTGRAHCQKIHTQRKVGSSSHGQAISGSHIRFTLEANLRQLQKNIQWARSVTPTEKLHRPALQCRTGSEQVFEKKRRDEHDAGQIACTRGPERSRGTVTSEGTLNFCAVRSCACRGKNPVELPVIRLRLWEIDFITLTTAKERWQY